MNILLLFFACFFLVSCSGSKNEPTKKITFQSENQFKTTLKGTWILKSYRDSISTGLTPMNICYLRSGSYRFFYDPSKSYSSLFPEDSSYYIFIDSKNIYTIYKDSIPNNEFEYTSQKGYTIALDLKESVGIIIDKIITSFYDKNLGKWKDSINEPHNIGSFYLTKYEKDTLLNIKFVNDPTERKIVLVKNDDYDIFLNKKFITGSYYLQNSDRDKLIIFNDSGFVSNLTLLNIGCSMANRYQIAIDSSVDKKNYLSFFHTENMLVCPILYWSRKGDTLILSESSINSFNRDFILIKK